MSLVDNGNGGMVMPVSPMGGYGGYGSGAFGGDGLFWLIVLFLFGFMGNGWGVGNGNGPANVAADVQRGFDQNALVTGINGVNSTLTSGFASAEANAAARQMAFMQQLNSIAMTQQQCCCENRAAIADVKYAIANDGAQTRTTMQAGNQAILDKLCQLELDGVKQNYENQIRAMQNTIDGLRGQVADARFDASQNSQTATIQAGQRNLANEVEQYLNPTPRPAWIVQNPNCCTNNNTCCNSSNGLGFVA